MSRVNAKDSTDFLLSQFLNGNRHVETFHVSGVKVGKIRRWIMI